MKPIRSSLVASVAALAGSAAAHAQCDARYTPRDIGDFGIVAPLSLEAVNASGHAAGWAYVDRLVEGNTVRFVTGAALYTGTLGTLPGLDEPRGRRWARDLNDSGTVVGMCEPPLSTNYVAAIWEGGAGPAQVIPMAFASTSSYATAVSNAGVVVGAAATAPGRRSGFVWNGRSPAVEIAPLAGGFSITPMHVNEDGVIVGTGVDAAGRSFAFVRTTGGIVSDLQPLTDGAAGWQFAGAVGVNRAGIIAVNGSLNGQPRAALLSPTGAGRYNIGLLTPLEGELESSVNAVSDEGVAVGLSYDEYRPGGPLIQPIWKAVLWDESGVRTLESLVPGGTGTTRLEGANDIGGSGHIAVSGRRGDEQRMVLLTPIRISDFDGDGTTDFFDLDAFVGAFEDGDERADIDGDGSVDFFDFNAFVEAFERGC
jgi:uncharacterized membrane protein